MNETMKIPDVLLERYLLGEVSTSERDRVHKALEQSRDVQARLDRLRIENEQVLKDYPPRVMAAAIHERAGRSTQAHRPLNLKWIGVPVAAALVLVVTLFVTQQTGTHGVKRGQTPSLQPAIRPVQAPDREAAPEVTRVKGDPRLMLYLDHRGEADELPAGSVAQAGDVVQVKYLAGDASHGVILSVDGRGAVTLHFPADESASTRLDPRGPQNLPRAYELDDAPEYERFIFVVSPLPIDVETVLMAAEMLERSANAEFIPDGEHRHFEFLLRKSVGKKGHDEQM
jgi:hypothetical protein